MVAAVALLARRHALLDAEYFVAELQRSGELVGSSGTPHAVGERRHRPSGFARATAVGAASLLSTKSTANSLP